MSDEITISDKNLANIKALLSEADKLEREAEAILETAGDRYDNVILIMQESMVPWKKIILTIQTKVFKDWPMKETGRPLGIQAAMDEGYAAAVWVNRFNAYRTGKYSDYGVVKAVERPPRLTDMTPEQRKEKRIEAARENTKRRMSTPHVISRELIQHDLAEIFTFATKIGNQRAIELTQQLYAILGFTEAVPQLREIVETESGVDVPDETTSSATSINA